jgi:antitoxin MazE
MQTTIRQIGNSRGLLIPSAFLASCAIEDSVDMQLLDGQIVIRPWKKQPREGWFTNAQAKPSPAMVLETADWDAATVADDSEWVW